MAKAFDELGHNMIIPSKEYTPTHRPPSPVQDFVWNETWDQEKIKKHFYTNNITCLNKEEILDLKPEIVFTTAYENKFEILNEIWPHLKSKSKIVSYSGNPYWKEAYEWDVIPNYLCADLYSRTFAEEEKKNFLYYRPWVNYDLFKFTGVNDSNLINSYISDYSKTFPNDYDLAKNIREELKDLVNINLYTEIPNKEVPIRMQASLATLHIKRLEGYGYAIIESMASGRPVFLYSGYSLDKSYRQWAIENVTALYFNTIPELRAKISALTSSPEYRNHLQSICASTIRSLINNEEQTSNLKKFLEELK